MSGLELSPRALAARTSPDRDRYLDLLRGLSITVVVLGHWLLAAVWVEDGQLQATSALAFEPWAAWLTWVLQVMPIFFLVGGVVNARSWRSARRDGQPWADWVRGRSARLLRPTLPLVWLWVLAGPAMVVAGLFPLEVARLGSTNALVPLWFLAVYLLVIALTPLTLALHERAGLWGVPVVALVAAGVDALDRSGVPIGNLNFVFVWVAAAQLGFCWGDGMLDGPWRRLALGAAGALLLALLVGPLGYPVNMVGAAGEASNQVPPTLALVGLGWVQAALVGAVRGPVTRWLQRPGPWRAVVSVNLVAMTLFLWHLTVLSLLIGLLAGLGAYPPIYPGTATWWATRPLYWAILLAVLVPVALVMARVEWSTRTPPPWPRAWWATPAAVLMLAGAIGAIGAVILFGVVGTGPAAAIGPTSALILTAAVAAVGGLRGTRPDRPALGEAAPQRG